MDDPREIINHSVWCKNHSPAGIRDIVNDLWMLRGWCTLVVTSKSSFFTPTQNPCGGCAHIGWGCNVNISFLVFKSSAVESFICPSHLVQAHSFLILTAKGTWQTLIINSMEIQRRSNFPHSLNVRDECRWKRLEPGDKKQRRAELSTARSPSAVLDTVN